MEREKTVVEITNRPSDRSGSHTRTEWTNYFQDKDNRETIQDLKEARMRLGGFTVRYMAEAIYGEEYTNRMFGTDGGTELIKDIELSKELLENLTQVSGKKTQKFAQQYGLNTPSRNQPKQELSENKSDDVAEQQAILLQALLKTMSPDVVNKVIKNFK